MTRYLLATCLLAATGPAAFAQPDPFRWFNPDPNAPRPTEPPPTVIKVPIVQPPTGYYKTFNVLVGADGYYPFDTGEWILSGYNGLARTHGTFAMVGPNGEVVHNNIVSPLYYPAPPAKHYGIFHHK